VELFGISIRVHNSARLIPTSAFEARISNMLTAFATVEDTEGLVRLSMLACGLSCQIAFGCKILINYQNHELFIAWKIG
jgi:hypothetical protein